MKYDPLTAYLRQSGENRIQLSFSQLESILSFSLGKSPRNHRAWWANGGHDHAAAWMDAGYKVDSVSLTQESVVFVKDGVVSGKEENAEEHKTPAPLQMTTCVSASLDLHKLIKGFWQYAWDESIDLYNEFSLQHELGIYLRGVLPDYKVQFERNVSFFGVTGNTTVKKEIDISIFTTDKKEKYAIELKYPRNGQYPEQMYAFAKDILFMEQLKENGFLQTCAVTLVVDRPFYEGEQQTGIYSYFRGGAPLNGIIYKPTGSTKGVEHIDIAGSYRIDWYSLDADRKYYIVTVG